jgi:hypothetical protein
MRLATWLLIGFGCGAVSLVACGSTVATERGGPSDGGAGADSAPDGSPGTSAHGGDDNDATSGLSASDGDQIEAGDSGVTPIAADDASVPNDSTIGGDEELQGPDAGAIGIDASVSPGDNSGGTTTVMQAEDAGASEDSPDEGGDGPRAPDTTSFEVDASVSPGIAAFAFIVNGVLQTPLRCPSDNWEFLPVNSGGQPVCTLDQLQTCPDGTTAVLLNIGTVPIAYTARSLWSIPYPPGVATGEPNVLVGVLAPQTQIDITSVFVGGITAIVGSAEPFSNPDAGRYNGDEGVIPWPGGVAGSGGAGQMWVA